MHSYFQIINLKVSFWNTSCVSAGYYLCKNKIDTQGPANERQLTIVANTTITAKRILLAKSYVNEERLRKIYLSTSDYILVLSELVKTQRK